LKICNGCGTEKLIDEFSLSRSKKDGHNNKCKECHRKYVKNHYIKNKSRYIARAKKNRKKEREKTKKLLLELKSGGCRRCSEDHPACLDFHHRDPSAKEKSVGLLKNSRSRIVKEAKKCDILCANCHRKEHYDGDVG
jgi:hypothetical protein